jgi:hypothetical protein
MGATQNHPMSPAVTYCAPVTLRYYGENPGLRGLGQNVQVASLPGTNSCNRKEAFQAKESQGQGNRSSHVWAPRLGHISRARRLCLPSAPIQRLSTIHLTIDHIPRLVSWALPLARLRLPETAATAATARRSAPILSQSASSLPLNFTAHQAF